MKNLTIITILAIGLSVIALSENIDGTLSVDRNGLSRGESYTNERSQGSYKSTYRQDKEVPSEEFESVSENIMEESSFVGIEGDYVTSSKANGVDKSGVSFGLRLGAQNIDWRTMVVFQVFSNSNNINSYVRALLQVDYYFVKIDNLSMDSRAVRPYVGLNIGGMYLDVNSSANIKTLTYGAEVGVTINITNNVDFDLAYRYNISSSKNIKHTSDITAGIHYKF